jgi:stearoyl-CoA desaturase (delta-9 desaturase)
MTSQESRSTGAAMAFLQRILEPPSYGFYDASGKLIRPLTGQIWREFFSRLNIFKDRRNWLPLTGWFFTFALTIPCVIFLFYYFNFWLFLIGITYSMVALGTHGTVYLHRYSTHRAFHFKNKFWLFICRNLVIKFVPVEVYVISHHVHHRYSEQPGDPYNVNGGWLYCFLADVNHQLISRSLSEADYRRVAGLMAPTGMKLNSYEQYKKWGSVTSPFRLISHILLNWAFWYSAFFLMGGHGLALAIFGLSSVWAFGIRTFNYDGHGRGQDKRQDGIDFNRADHSINQIWPGYVAGEWHNNHHLFPNSARNDFQPYQLDLAWLTIRTFHKLGALSSYRDDKAQFVAQYLKPAHGPRSKSGLLQPEQNDYAYENSVNTKKFETITAHD